MSYSYEDAENTAEHFIVAVIFLKIVIMWVHYLNQAGDQY